MARVLVGVKRVIDYAVKVRRHEGHGVFQSFAFACCFLLSLVALGFA